MVTEDPSSGIQDKPKIKKVTWDKMWVNVTVHRV